MINHIVCIVSDFDNTIKANREAATKALEEVANINNVIQQAQEKTQLARDAMKGADEHADMS